MTITITEFLALPPAEQELEFARCFRRRAFFDAVDLNRERRIDQIDIEAYRSILPDIPALARRGIRNEVWLSLVISIGRNRHIGYCTKNQYNRQEQGFQ